MHVLHEHLKYWMESFRMQLGCIGATYGMLLNIYLAAHFIVEERVWIVSFINNFLHLLLMFTVVSISLVAVSPRYRLLYLFYNVPGLVYLLIWLSPLVLPLSQTDTSEECQNQIRVLTYNVAKSTVPLDTIMKNDFRYDIIGFQELGINSTPSSGYWISAGRIGIYSRFPIMNDTLKEIQIEVDRVSTIGLRVMIEVYGSPIAVYNVHPERPGLSLRPFRYTGGLRSIAYKQLSTMLADEQYPTIMLCDCNFTWFTTDYRQVAHYLNDAWRTAGIGLGWTAPAPHGPTGLPFPVTRSDYIWYSDHFCLMSVAILHETVSDHFPFMATFALRSRDLG